MKIDPGSQHSSIASTKHKDLREKWLAKLPTERINRLRYDWRYWARPEQIPPEGNWQKWLFLGGRGCGKTRAGAEAVLEKVQQGVKRIALIGPTGGDVRDVMAFGPSGIVTVAPPWCRPDPFLHRQRHLVWANGAIATLFSADEPERFRGPQHEYIWCDEIAAWRYAREAYEMLMLGLRLGENPQVIVTTTPKPIDILIGTGENGRMLGLLNDPGCVITRGSSYENRANLADTFFSQIIRQYEGTRLGRQELEAQIIEDLGGLWSRAMIEESRVRSAAGLDFSRIVVAIDPAASSGEESDETGIVVAGKTINGQGFVLGDFSGRYKPIEWAQRAIGAYKEFSADRICAEVNNGGDMVEATIRMVDPDVPFTAVRASRGKVMRAEPVAALYEQHRIHHVGSFPVLEDQMASFTSDFDRKAAGYSPDRVDALVWAITELLVEQTPYEGLLSYYEQEAARQRASTAGA